MSDSIEFTDDTTVTVNDGIVACEISSGSALLNLDTSRYFKLNATAALLWEKLDADADKTLTVRALCDVLVARFDIEVQDCRDDIVAICRHFAKAGLVTVRAA